MTRSTVPQHEQRLPCLYCGERYGPDEHALHTDAVHCGRCITCVDKPACFECRLMYCICDVHRSR